MDTFDGAINNVSALKVFLTAHCKLNVLMGVTYLWDM